METETLEAPPQALPPAPFTPEWVKDIVGYHQPDSLGIEHISRIRAAAEGMINTIIQECPPSADRSAAIRKVREAMMTANASIVLSGRG